MWAKIQRWFQYEYYIWANWDNFWPIRFRKLYNSESLKYKWELCIGWRTFSLTGFWFKEHYNE